MRVFATMAMMVACGQGGVTVQEPEVIEGPQGDQGPPGERGEPGPPGTDANAAFRWIDAAGAEVSPNPTLGGFDAEGNWWAIDDATGRYTAAESGVRWVYWTTTNCSGDRIVHPTLTSPDSCDTCVAPMHQLESITFRNEPGTWAWPSGATPRERCAKSYTPLSGRGCAALDTQICDDWLLFTDLVELAPPEQVFAPPFHRAR